MTETSNATGDLTAGERRALLAEILQKKTTQSTLSFAQERLWVLGQLEPHSAAFAVQAAVRVSRPLDDDVLRRSLEEIVRRHEVLRATFVEREGRPVQAIGEAGPVEPAIVDLTRLPEEDRQKRVRRLAQEEAQRPFVLRTGPLLRVALVRVDADEHVLLLTMHHIVSDGWSMGVLIRELAALYGAYSEGKRSPLAELPVQYADYAVWQREQLQGELLEEQLSYWRERLGHDPPALQLPADRARPPLQTYRGANVTTRLPKELSDRIEALDEQEGASLFMTMLAAFKALLARYTGQDDVVVGTFVANRTRPEVEGLIGFFVNTLALRTDLAGDPTFRELVGRVRESSLGAYAHQDLPFEKLLEELQPHRDLSRTPFFQVAFTVEPSPEAEKAAGGRFERADIHPGTSPFDLTLWITEDAGELELAFEYSTDLFEPETVARLAGHYRTLLEGAVADPDTRLSRLPLLSDEERQQLLVDFNQTSREHENADRCIHQLFEIQADRTPDAPALVDGERTLTYGELNEAANRLAHDLIREHGIGPETLVAVCLPRTADAIIALLGILKAGAAYVPLDPNHPRERLEFMLEDAAAPVLVTEHALLDRLPHYPATLCLDTAPDEIRTQPDGNPDIPTKPDHLAYVIYTSGSTGRPKGVLGLHRGAVNLISWLWEAFPFEDGEVAAQRTSLTFVDAVWEIFVPLLGGVPLVIASEETVKDPSRLVGLLERNKVTRLVAVPSLLKMMLGSDVELETRLAGLRYCFSSGEALPLDLYRRFTERLPGTALVNVYGTSEVSADATAFDTRTAEVGTSVPIGRPIANTQVYILDGHLQPVPLGVPGEICVGGAALARGYLNRPELTAERFVVNPFEPSSRLYRTGDVSRFLPDGNIEYLGRADHQIKVRGFRVELGEIESVLAEHPAVAEAVVVARAESGEETRIVAYVVPTDQDEPAIADVRAFVSEKLPEYMVPPSFVVLPALPLTATGKVDRMALPEPDSARPDLLQPYVPPETPHEVMLAKIFSEVLRIEQIGIHDGFFDLGGHSLRVIELLAKVRDRFEVDFPMRVLYETSTVALLARAIESIRHAGVEAAPTAVDSPIDFMEEAVLDPDIRPEDASPYVPKAESEHIFLTGATGFLGVHLLHELLQQTDANIYCLVRADTAEKGKLRIKEQLEASFHWDPQLSSRIIPVLGDLTKPRFGLSPERFDEVARIVDAIYHSGAYVNFVFPYSALKAANVLGTQEAIRLACRIRLKPLHHISLTDVALYRNEEGTWVIDEGPADVYPRGIFMSGYAQTKWVAERLVTLAQERGLPVTIYRPGFIEGNSETGFCNKTSELCLTLKGCIALGTAPDHDMMFDCAVADYASKAFVYISTKPESIGGIYGAVCPWPVHIRDVEDWISEAGYLLKRVPYPEWREQVLEEVAPNPDHPLYPLLPYSVDEEIARMPLAFPCDTSNTLKALEGSGIVCPRIDLELLKKCLNYLVGVGFLDTPQPQAAHAEAVTQA